MGPTVDELPIFVASSVLACSTGSSIPCRLKMPPFWSLVPYILTFSAPNLRHTLQVLRDGIRPDGTKFLKKGMAAEDQVGPVPHLISLEVAQTPGGAQHDVDSTHRMVHDQPHVARGQSATSLGSLAKA